MKYFILVVPEFGLVRHSSQSNSEGWENEHCTNISFFPTSAPQSSSGSICKRFFILQRENYTAAEPV